MLVLSCVRQRGTPDHRASYEWAVSVNGVMIARGQVEAHDRADGWERLVELVAEVGRERRQVRAVTRLAAKLERGLAIVVDQEIIDALASRPTGRSTPRRTDGPGAAPVGATTGRRRTRFSRGGRV